MSIVSSATRRRDSGGMCAMVRMLCSRSASLTSKHAHILGDRQQQLAQVFRLLGLARDEVEPLELGQPFDQVADVLAEQLVDLGARRLGVLDGVVQQRRRDRGIIELVIGEDRGDFERMGEIGIARGALLLAMGLHGIDIGAVEQALVGIADCIRAPARRGRIAASSAWRASAPARRAARCWARGAAPPCGTSPGSPCAADRRTIAP